MSNRDPGAPVEIPAPPEAHEAPGAPPPVGAADPAAADPPLMVPRVSAEEMASWVRLEHISWETAERLLAAARQDFHRSPRAERAARDAPQDPARSSAGENEMPEGVATPGGRAQSAPQQTKKKK